MRPLYFGLLGLWFMGGCGDGEASWAWARVERVSDCHHCHPDQVCIPFGLRGYGCVKAYETGAVHGDDGADLGSDAQSSEPPSQARPFHGSRPTHRDERELIEDFFDG